MWFSEFKLLKSSPLISILTLLLGDVNAPSTDRIGTRDILDWVIKRKFLGKSVRWRTFLDLV